MEQLPQSKFFCRDRPQLRLSDCELVFCEALPLKTARKAASDTRCVGPAQPGGTSARWRPTTSAHDIPIL